MTPVLVLVGAMVGAPARYLIDRAVRLRFGAAFPWGTFVVNVAGSFVLGLIIGAALDMPMVSLLGVGFCGALTTYSTFGYETVLLVHAGARRAALLNAAGSILAAFTAAWLGLMLGELIS